MPSKVTCGGLICSFSSSALSQFISITTELAVKGRDGVIEKVWLLIGDSGKAFSGEGIWIGKPGFLDLLQFQYPWLSWSSWGSQFLWNCMLLLKSNFHALFLCKKMPAEKFLNLDILVLTVLPRVVAFVRAFLILHVNFILLAYLVLITVLC